MRFSLKWILLATVYVAIAAAAFTQTHWAYADALWVVSLLAVAYAILLTAFARGRRQVAAAGFVVASVCFLTCLTFGGDAVPTTRLLAATGVGQSNPGSVAYYSPPPGYAAYAPQPVYAPMPAPSSAPTPVPGSYPPAGAGPPAQSPTAAITYVAPMTTRARFVDFRIYTRAANAVATMLFGFIGSLVGLIAYRAADKSQ